MNSELNEGARACIAYATRFVLNRPTRVFVIMSLVSECKLVNHALVA